MEEKVAAVAQIVWGCDGRIRDATSEGELLAIVTDPAHVRGLTRQWRIVGVKEPDSGGAAMATGARIANRVDATNDGDDDDTVRCAAALRLRLEEIYVGVRHGFLTMKESIDSSEDDGTAAFCQELVASVERPDDRLSSRVSQLQFALTPLQRIRLRVFRDLWEKGYFVAFGSKFSADFLIYEDDPSRAHATALVIVKEYGAAFACVDIVSHCRVAKMVKKQVFFASQHPDKDRDEVVYIAVNHALLATHQEL